jgi:hypothetical protein
MSAKTKGSQYTESEEVHWKGRRPVDLEPFL